ncbi:MAG: sigma-70 family RNA polymerase sigma factor [Verrucomicrobiae bacterium]|nr:sigma-70 family RNA polymerase sigma factor [Verrucomicrobiae bacterium]
MSNPIKSMTDKADPDYDLMRRIADGNEAALTELIGKYKTPVHSFVYRMLNDADEADDVSQEVFIKVFRTADLYRPRAKFTTWLFAVANNLATDRLRKRQRRPTVTGEEAESKWEAVTDHRENPREALCRKEYTAAVQQAIEQLPADQKTAILLYEFEDMSYAEIAEVMRCSVKSVEARLYRAKDLLRTRLAKWL